MDKKCYVCRKKLNTSELKEITELCDKVKRTDYICDKCLAENMSIYGGCGEVCMSGADDMYVDYRTAYHCFGM